MKSLDVVAAVVLVIGGINWGAVGLFNIDLVAVIFGEMSALSRLIYLAVGASAAYQAFQWKGIQRRWAHAAAPA